MDRLTLGKHHLHRKRLPNTAEQLLGLQLWGSSTSGGLPDWRRFDLAGISGLIVLAEGFANRKLEHWGPEGDWDEIYMAVA